MTLEELKELKTFVIPMRNEFPNVADAILRLVNDYEDSQDFMAFMAAELDRIPCCHADGSHKGTPPMMWPELIRCMIKHAVNKALVGEKP